jgi:hypothetical protein
MKRNLDLIRKILIDVEGGGYASDPTGGASRIGDLPIGGDTDHDVITYHLLLLEEAGYVRVRSDDDDDDDRSKLVRLTWQGHDYLDKIRDDSAGSVLRDEA